MLTAIADGKGGLIFRTSGLPTVPGLERTNVETFREYLGSIDIATDCKKADAGGQRTGYQRARNGHRTRGTKKDGC